MKDFQIRCRGIIIDQGELLAVVHTGKDDRFVLPGGHLEWGEAIPDGLVRELKEELGIEALVGALLHVHSFMNEDTHVVEFFLAVHNAAEFRNFASMERTHKCELSSVAWLPLGSMVAMKPVAMAQKLAAGTLGHESFSFIHRAEPQPAETEGLCS